jgi:hypothetical protein
MPFAIEPQSRQDCFVYAAINGVAAAVELATGDRYQQAGVLLLVAFVQLLMGLKLVPEQSLLWPAKVGGFVFLVTLGVVAIIYGHIVRGSLYCVVAIAGAAILTFLNRLRRPNDDHRAPAHEG